MICRPILTYSTQGWLADYDEIVEWPNGPRIAKIFTYTRQVKCLARLLPSNRTKKSRSKIPKDKNSELWPCKVLFRMPDPLDPSRKAIAEELLRLEPNILVQPYGFKENILPKLLAKVFTKDFKTGRWISAGSILPWQPNLRKSDTDMNKDIFSRAIKLALADTSTPGCYEGVPLFENNSLLLKKYRVQSVESLMPMKGQLIPNMIKEGKENGDKSLHNSKNPPVVSRKHIVHFSGGNNIPKQVLLDDNNEIYPSHENPERFAVKIKIGGNDLFLGEYPSMSTAVEALKLYRGMQQEGQPFSDATSQVIRDIHAIKSEAVISAWKSNAVKDKKTNFSPKEWSKAYIEKAARDPSKWLDPLERAFPKS